MIRATRGGYRKDPANVEAWPMTGRPVRKIYYNTVRRRWVMGELIDVGRPDPMPYNAIFQHENPEHVDGERNVRGTRGRSIAEKMEYRLEAEGRMSSFMIERSKPVTVQEIVEGCDILRRTVAKYLKEGVQFECVQEGSRSAPAYWKIVGEPWTMDDVGRERKVGDPKTRGSNAGQTWRKGAAVWELIEWLSDNGPASIREMFTALDWSRGKTQKIVQVRYSQYFLNVGKRTYFPKGAVAPIDELIYVVADIGG